MIEPNAGDGAALDNAAAYATDSMGANTYASGKATTLVVDTTPSDNYSSGPMWTTEPAPINEGPAPTSTPITGPGTWTNATTASAVPDGQGGSTISGTQSQMSGTSVNWVVANDAPTWSLGDNVPNIGATSGVEADITGSSQSLYDQLPARLQNKTVATDGTTNTISGYGASLPDGYTYVDPNDVIQRADEIGHQLRNAGAMDQGIPGQYSASHAEKQVITNNPSAVQVDVSRAMCTDCQAFYQAEAVVQGRPITVSDPNVIRTFFPNGAVAVTPRN